MSDKVEQFADILKESNNIVFFGGAGVSTASNIPDFRSNEKTFALLYQASGRAGRSNLKGSVIIQTYNPDNYVLNCVKNNDFNSLRMFIS